MKPAINFTKERVLRYGPLDYTQVSYLRLQELKIKIADLIIKDVEENRTVTQEGVRSLIDPIADVLAIKQSANEIPK